MILCEFLVGTGGGNVPTIILDSSSAFIGDDLSVGRADLITRIGRKDLILELVDSEGTPTEWINLCGLPLCITELLEGGKVVKVIDGKREIGIVNPIPGEELDNGVVNYAV